MEESEKIVLLEKIATSIKYEAIKLYETTELHWQDMGDTEAISSRISQNMWHVNDLISDAFAKSFSSLLNFDDLYVDMGEDIGKVPLYIAARYLCQTAFLKAYFMHKVSIYDYIPPPNESVPEIFIRTIVETKYGQSGHYIEGRLQHTIGWYLINYPFEDLCNRFHPDLSIYFLDPKNQFRDFTGLIMNYAILASRAEEEFTSTSETKIADIVSLQPSFLGLSVDVKTLGKYVQSKLEKYRSSRP